MRVQMLSSFYDSCNDISVLLLAHGELPMPRSEASLTFPGTFWTVESKLHVLFELIRAILTTENVRSHPLVAGQMWLIALIAICAKLLSRSKLCHTRATVVNSRADCGNWPKNRLVNLNLQNRRFISLPV
jgi:hypothetical protein